MSNEYPRVKDKVIDGHLHIEAWTNKEGEEFIHCFEEYREKVNNNQEASELLQKELNQLKTFQCRLVLVIMINMLLMIRTNFYLENNVQYQYKQLQDLIT